MRSKIWVACGAVLALVLTLIVGISPATAAGYPYAVTTRYIGGGSTVNVRSQPSVTSQIVRTLANGSAISISCQQVGSPLGFSAYANNRTWDRLVDGTYVHDVVTTTPAGPHVALSDGGYVAWTAGIPQCVIGSSAPAPTNHGAAAAAWALSQDTYSYPKSGGYCNQYSAHWNRPCEEWCADFAAEAWQVAGVSFTYGPDLNAGSSSFYRWGRLHNAWHDINSGYVPKPGDAILFGTPSSAAHVAIYVSGRATRPDAVNGDMWRSNGTVQVWYVQRQISSNGQQPGTPISGYVSIP